MCVEMPCGYSSQTLAKITAYLDIIIGILTLIIFIILWGFCTGRYPEACQSLLSASTISHYSQNYKCLFSQDGAYNLLLFVGLFYCFGTLILALILLDGAQRRDHLTLWKWLINSYFLWIVRILIYIVWIFTAEEKVGPLMMSCANMFYNGVTILMINILRQHIEEEGVLLYSRKRRFD